MLTFYIERPKYTNTELFRHRETLTNILDFQSVQWTAAVGKEWLRLWRIRVNDEVRRIIVEDLIVIITTS